MNYKFRYKVRKVLRKLPDRYYIIIVYFLTYKRFIRLNKPRLWTEKIQYKKLYDRREKLTEVANKVKLRQYVKRKIGFDITPDILWEGKNPYNIPFDQLPVSFVIKTNHGSGTNIIVRNKNEINKSEVIEQLKYWLKRDFYYPEKQWAYKNIDRLVFIERLLLSENGSIPPDIKLYMFNGSLGAINIHYNRFGDNHQNLLVDSDFYLLDGENYKSKQLRNLKPKNFSTMLAYAEKLSSDFDFIRVDFYDLGDEVKLSELTHYPVGGFKRMPYQVDKYLGNLWTIKEYYN